MADSDPDQVELNLWLDISSCGFLSSLKHPLREPLLLMPHPLIPGHSWFVQLGSGVRHWLKETYELQNGLAVLDVLEGAEKA